MAPPEPSLIYMKIEKAIPILVATTNKHPVLSPQNIPLRAYFLGVESPLVKALVDFVDSNSATCAIPCYPGTIWRWRREQAAAAGAE